jgi:hypothetical protein
LGHDDFLRSIDYEVATLIIHALLVPNDELIIHYFIIFAAQVALAAPYHHWNPS